jgi:hypothetical protein
LLASCHSAVVKVPQNNKKPTLLPVGSRHLY